MHRSWVAAVQHHCYVVYKQCSAQALAVLLLAQAAKLTYMSQRLLAKYKLDHKITQYAIFALYYYRASLSYTKDNANILWLLCSLDKLFLC